MKFDYNTKPENYKLPNGWWWLNHYGKPRNHRKKDLYRVYWCPKCKRAWQTMRQSIQINKKHTAVNVPDYLPDFSKRYLEESSCRECK